MKDGLTTTQKGDIIEHLIADLIVLSSNGKLTTYVPVSDSEGIDIIVNQRNSCNPIYIQVKGRFKLSKGPNIYLDIRKSTFNPNPRLYCIFAYFDKKNMGLYDYLWLVPSQEIERLPIHIVKGKPCYRFVASIKLDSKDQWSKFKVKREELSNKLEAVLSGFM